MDAYKKELLRQKKFKYYKHIVSPRHARYKYLAKEMGIPLEEAHFAKFGIAQCKQAISIAKKYLVHLKKGATF